MRPSSTAHGPCRSLLQKAVRRGQLSLVRQLVAHLVLNGERSWLSRRIAVITAEECWPLLAIFRGGRLHSQAALLEEVASAGKDRAAAGLGTLALAYNNGDEGVLRYGDPPDIRQVARGLSAPSWTWELLSASGVAPEPWEMAFRRAGWPWDQACIVAAAHLQRFHPAVVDLAEPLDLPYWIALDRHTVEGRRALRRVAVEQGLSPAVVGWVSFYEEGALGTALQLDGWWLAEKSWRYSLHGIDSGAASAIWTRIRRPLEDALEIDARALADHIAAPASDSAEQLTLTTG